MVGYPADVRQVILGPDGVLAGCKPGNIVVDMTTSEPSLAVEIAEAAASRRRPCRRCARLRRRRRRPRGPAVDHDRRRRGRRSKPCGPAGRRWARRSSVKAVPAPGQHTKMVNQILIAANMIGVCEALLYAYKAGLDLDTRNADRSAAGRPGVGRSSNLGPRIIANNFEPGFFVEHFIKDMGIALAEAKRMGLCLPGLALANQLYLSLAAHGHGRDGTQALQLALAANVERRLAGQRLIVALVTARVTPRPSRRA